MEEKLTHFDEKGNAIMVDVTEKKITSRTATASGKIHVNEAVMKAVLEGTVAKGDVLGVARVAGIMAVKQTAHLIPMCHTLLITKCSVDFEVDEKELTIKALCTAKLEGKTGVEMEALTGPFMICARRSTSGWRSERYISMQNREERAGNLCDDRRIRQNDRLRPDLRDRSMQPALCVLYAGGRRRQHFP